VAVLARLAYSPDQPRDDHGRFGEGESGSSPAGSAGLDALNTSAAKFDENGGSTEPLDLGENKDEIDIEDVVAQLDDVHELVGEDLSDRSKVGFLFTEYAIRGAVEDNTSTIVAQGEGVGMAGAISVIDRPEETTEDGTVPAYAYVDYLGSTGVVPGAGSALVKAAAGEAAAKGLPLMGSPTPDALPFWQSVGWTQDPLGVGSDYWGWTAEETKAAAA
jgi:hypothetical protein